MKLPTSIMKLPTSIMKLPTSIMKLPTFFLALNYSLMIILILSQLVVKADPTTLLDQIESELNYFDETLGKLLNKRQSQLWSLENRDYGSPTMVTNAEELPSTTTTKSLHEKLETFLTTLHSWAVYRYEVQLKKNCSRDDDSGGEKQLQRLCQYLRLVVDRFRFDHNSNPNHSASKNHQLLSRLSDRFKRIEIKFGDHRYCGDDSVNRLMSQLNSTEDLRLVWNEWRSQVSVHLWPLFRELLVGLDPASGANIWKQLHSDLGDVDQLLPEAHRLWSQVEPFYLLLADYLRVKLVKQPEKSSGSIPVHLLRSLTGTQFDSIYEQVKPYPGPEKNNPANNNNNQSILDIATEIYLQFGFDPLPDQLWENSQLLPEPSNSQESGPGPSVISCQPLTFDFFTRLSASGFDSTMEDIRIRMCLPPKESQKNTGTGPHLRKILHELGHVYYFDAYRSSRNLFKISNVNSAIHEAIGETVSMANSGCELGNLESGKKQFRTSINRLLWEALTSFVRIPYGLSLEQWRHDILMQPQKWVNSQHDLNQHYWNIREKIQQIVPPGPSNTNDQPNLDPLFKYHVVNFVPYLRYVFATFLQHQLYEELCSDQQDPGKPQFLCCPSQKSWNKFRKFMSESGHSIQYRAEPLLNYYRPLIEWLTEWKQKQQMRNAAEP